MIASRQSTYIQNLIDDAKIYYCLECGKCTARCPIARADKSFSPVLNIVKTIRGVNQEIPRNGSIWTCMLCEACSDACPADVNYPRLVLGLRAQAVLSGDERTYRRELEKLFLIDGKDEGFGKFAEVSAIQIPDSIHKGGVVTSLLNQGLSSGTFDAAIVVRRGPDHKPEACIVENSEDITLAKGSKYELVPIPEKLIEAVQLRGKKRIAVVGLPCQVVGIREIQKYLPDVDLTVIGLFCMENFRHNLLKQNVADVLNIDIDSAERIFISKGNFIVISGDKTTSCKIKDLHSAVRTGCLFCTDFTSELADISIGMVGSPDGYSTVIVRSQKGADLLRLLNNYNRKFANHEEIAKMSSRKLNHGLETLTSLFKNGGVDEQ